MQRRYDLDSGEQAELLSEYLVLAGRQDDFWHWLDARMPTFEREGPEVASEGDDESGEYDDVDEVDESDESDDDHDEPDEADEPVDPDLVDNPWRRYPPH